MKNRYKMNEQEKEAQLLDMRRRFASYGRRESKPNKLATQLDEQRMTPVHAKAKIWPMVLVVAVIGFAIWRQLHH